MPIGILLGVEVLINYFDRINLSVRAGALPDSLKSFRARCIVRLPRRAQ